MTLKFSTFFMYSLLYYYYLLTYFTCHSCVSGLYYCFFALLSLETKNNIISIPDLLDYINVIQVMFYFGDFKIFSLCVNNLTSSKVAKNSSARSQTIFKQRIIIWWYGTSNHCGRIIKRANLFLTLNRWFVLNFSFFSFILFKNLLTL